MTVEFQATDKAGNAEGAEESAGRATRARATGAAGVRIGSETPLPPPKALPESWVAPPGGEAAGVKRDTASAARL